MKTCRYYQKQLVRLAGNELPPSRQLDMERHLRHCPACQLELTRLQTIVQGTRMYDAEMEKEMEAIDWNQSVQDVVNKVRAAPRPQKQTWRNWRHAWPVWTPIMTSVFLLGIFIGHFLITHPASLPQAGQVSPDQAVFLKRMETQLARREIVQYLGESQVLLTSLMKQCGTPSSSQLERLDREKVRFLLDKSRYFRDQLDESGLANSKGLLQKLHWILTEISSMENPNDCQHLQRIQQSIQTERLLFKIRLVEDELNYNKINEV